MAQDKRGLMISRQCGHMCSSELPSIRLVDSKCCICAGNDKLLWCGACQARADWNDPCKMSWAHHARRRALCFHGFHRGEICKNSVLSHNNEISPWQN